MLINAAAIKLTLRRAVPELWRLGNGGNTWNGIGGETGSKALQKAVKDFSKKMERNECRLEGR